MEFLPAVYRAVQPEHKAGETTLNGTRKNPSPSRTKHYETLHFSPTWHLSMGTEERLGVVPANWSTTNAMNDPRPNGRSVFDARFTQSPLGRMRASGFTEMYDPREVHYIRLSLVTFSERALELKVCLPYVLVWFQVVFGGDPLMAAAEMADETLAAASSAEIHKIENNQGAREGVAVWT